MVDENVITRMRYLKEVKERYRGWYTYNLDPKVNLKRRITVTCKHHGDFTVKAYSHLKRYGYGCPTCARLKKENPSEFFILKAKEVHGDTYDYSEVNYEHSNSQVNIICKIHGMFKQRPSTHLKGCGCIKCTNRVPMDPSLFISRAEAIHGDTYDYSKTRYTSSTNKVTIICRKHGEFEQLPYNHINCSYSGCPICGDERRLTIRHEESNCVWGSPIPFATTQSTFLVKAHIVHGDKYDYSLAEYKLTEIPVKIICREHGVFEQRPNSHLQGCGCPKCGIISAKLKKARRHK